MHLELSDFLDPEAVARLGRLELVARTLVDGFIKGLHFSAQKGSSTEFAEHRPYVPGDEIRHIDWRTYGRSDRFYLKQYDDETNVRVTVVLDVSASMGFGSHEVTKFRYASCLAAALGQLLLHQRDAFGLVLAGQSIEGHVPPRATPQHLQGVLAKLESTRPGGSTGLADCLHRLAARLESRSFVVILSDCLEDPQALLHSIAHLRHRRAEAILFHVVDPAEESFPFTNWTVFRDAEDPASRLRLDARQVRETYLENLAQHLDALRRGCSAADVDHEVTRTSTPFELSLATYLDARRRRWR